MTCVLLRWTWTKPSWSDPVRAVREGMVPFFSLEMTSAQATLAQGVEPHALFTSAATLEPPPALSELVCFDPYAASRGHKPATDCHWSSPGLTGNGPRT